MSQFKATREKSGGIELIRLHGVIDETVDFSQAIGNLPPVVTVICRDIVQINSLGVKAWMTYFSAQTASGVRLSFAECPPPMIEQLNYIHNFPAGGKVVSISVPFSCSKCSKKLRGTIKTEDLKRVSYRLRPIRCVSCGGQARFDDIPEEYFAFLIRSPG